MTSPLKPVVGLVGTSIANGSSASLQECHVIKACKAAGMPYLGLARGGESASILKLTPNHTVRFALLRMATDVICEHLANDFGGAVNANSTFAVVSGNMRTLHSQLAGLTGAQGVPMRVWQMTPPPSYNKSTDGWLTMANESINDNETVRRQLAAWVRASCPESGGVPVQAGTGGAVVSPFLAGIFNAGPQAETAQDSGIWPADGTPGGRYTGDGVHPTDIGHIAMSTMINTAAIQAAFNAVNPTYLATNLHFCGKA